MSSNFYPSEFDAGLPCTNPFVFDRAKSEKVVHMFIFYDGEPRIVLSRTKSSLASEIALWAVFWVEFDK